MMRSTPPMIKAPTQRIAPKRAVSNAVAILRNACPMYRIAFISFCFWFLIYADLRALGVCFTSFSVSRLSDIFFMRLSVTSVCFCFRGFWKVGIREYKFFWKNTTQRSGDFFRNRRLDLVFTLRSRKHLCSWHRNYLRCPVKADKWRWTEYRDGNGKEKLPCFRQNKSCMRDYGVYPFA